MLFSIITVVYNNHRTIADALESVLGQDYRPLEYFIIDGESTDGTLEVIRRYEDKLRKIVVEPDEGIYDALNKGIRLAQGEVIGLLNSDDLYISPQVLTNVAAIFQAQPTIDIVYGDLVYVKAADIYSIVRYWTSKPYYARFFEEGEIPPHPAVFIRKRVYDQIGGFDLHLKFAADYEFLLRAMKRHGFKSHYLPEILVRMRLDGVSNNNWKNIVRGNWEIYRAWKMNGLRPPFYFWVMRFLKGVTV
ncbi:MAG: glycosyltransferase family 2 protein [Spirosomataceae bacterium]